MAGSCSWTGELAVLLPRNYAPADGAAAGKPKPTKPAVRTVLKSANTAVIRVCPANHDSAVLEVTLGAQTLASSRSLHLAVRCLSPSETGIHWLALIFCGPGQPVYCIRFQHASDGEAFNACAEQLKRPRQQRQQQHEDGLLADASSNDVLQADAKTVIRRLLTDPSFQAYVDQVDRLWDEVEAEMCDELQLATTDLQ